MSLSNRKSNGRGRESKRRSTVRESIAEKCLLNRCQDNRKECPPGVVCVDYEWLKKPFKSLSRSTINKRKLNGNGSRKGVDNVKSKESVYQNTVDESPRSYTGFQEPNEYIKESDESKESSPIYDGFQKPPFECKELRSRHECYHCKNVGESFSRCKALQETNKRNGLSSGFGGYESRTFAGESFPKYAGFQETVIDNKELNGEYGGCVCRKSAEIPHARYYGLQETKESQGVHCGSCRAHSCGRGHGRGCRHGGRVCRRSAGSCEICGGRELVCGKCGGLCGKGSGGGTCGHCGWNGVRCERCGWDVSAYNICGSRGIKQREDQDVSPVITNLGNGELGAKRYQPPLNREDRGTQCPNSAECPRSGTRKPDKIPSGKREYLRQSVVTRECPRQLNAKIQSPSKKRTRPCIPKFDSIKESETSPLPGKERGPADATTIATDILEEIFARMGSRRGYDDGNRRSETGRGKESRASSGVRESQASGIRESQANGIRESQAGGIRESQAGGRREPGYNNNRNCTGGRDCRGRDIGDRSDSDEEPRRDTQDYGRQSRYGGGREPRGGRESRAPARRESPVRTNGREYRGMNGGRTDPDTCITFGGERDCGEKSDSDVLPYREPPPRRPKPSAYEETESTRSRSQGIQCDGVCNTRKQEPRPSNRRPDSYREYGSTRQSNMMDGRRSAADDRFDRTNKRDDAEYRGSRPNVIRRCESSCSRQYDNAPKREGRRESTGSRDSGEVTGVPGKKECLVECTLSQKKTQDTGCGSDCAFVQGREDKRSSVDKGDSKRESKKDGSIRRDSTDSSDRRASVGSKRGSTKRESVDKGESAADKRESAADKRESGAEKRESGAERRESGADKKQSASNDKRKPTVAETEETGSEGSEKEDKSEKGE